MRYHPIMSEPPVRLETADDDLALPYTAEVLHNEDGFFARVPDLPGCMTWTDTVDELWPMIEDAKRAWITVALEEGVVVPLPRESALDMVSVRLPEELYRKLRRLAARDGVSLEACVAEILARALAE